MNLKEQQPLWHKLQIYSFDEPGCLINFSAKLAKTQKWQPEFTARVIEEYRKFIFLCCVSERGASPSQIVDEAWHLHLTYTKAYWVDFCKNTLGRDIHHYPSKGGADEDIRHEKWYKDTLQLYETVFGISPPTDIWPRPMEAVTPEEIPTFRIENKTMYWAATLIVLPFFYLCYTYHILNPFQLSGPHFLWFYFLLSLAVAGVIILYQKDLGKKFNPICNLYFSKQLNVFQLTQFLFGNHRAIQTAIVDLIRRNLLLVNSDTSFQVCNENYNIIQGEENPLLAKWLFEDNGAILNYQQIATDWYREPAFTDPLLEKIAIYSWSYKTKPAFRYFKIAFFVVGFLRLLQSFFNHRPGIFLIIEMLLFALFLGLLAHACSFQNMVFKIGRKLFREQWAASQLAKDSLVNEFAWKGPTAITGYAEGYKLCDIFSKYYPLGFWTGFSLGIGFLQPLHWGDSNGAGCGGAGCGGGGCGGGGCGGGGCGGCGGCGGG